MQFFSQPRTQLILRLAPWLIAAVALSLRLYGINWDDGHFFHPDERSVFMRVHCMYQTLTDTPGWQGCADPAFPRDTPGVPSIGTFLDKDASPLNPHWFPIGSILLYLLVAVEAALDVFIDRVSLHDLAMAGRTIAALVDTGTVLLLFALGRRLYGRTAGLLAAAFWALTVMAIQLAHYYRPEPFVMLLGVASFWWMLNVLERGRPWDHVLLGVMVGLSFAFRASSYLLLLPLALTYGVLVWRAVGNGRTDLATLAVGGRAVVAGAVAFATFALFQPYALLDFDKFMADLLWEAAKSAGSVPYTVQYVGIPRNGIYELRQTAVWAVGLPLGIIVWGGLAAAFWRAYKRPLVVDWLFLVWVVPFLITMVLYEVKFLRYVAPILPILVLLGARWLETLRDWASKRSRLLERTALGLTVFVLFATAFYAFAFARTYAPPHTAVQASAWMNANAPAGGLVLTDNHWDEGFPDLGRFRVVQLPMYEPDTPAKVARLAQALAEADYVMAYSNRPWGSIAPLPDRYPFSSNFYHRLFDGDLGYEVAQAFASYPTLLGVSLVHDPFTRATLPRPPLPGAEPGGLALDLGYADENVANYDHPLVLVWRNTGRLDPNTLLARIMDVTPADTGERAMFSPEAWAEQRMGGTWTAIFSESGLNRVAPWLVWLFFVELIYLAGLPLAMRFFRWLPDRGVVLARAFALLAVSWLVWLGASVGWWQFGRGSVVAAIAIVAVVSGVLFFGQRRELVELARRHWRYLVAVEGLFVVAYLIFVIVRAANPDLWHAWRGGEKPMDLAYLTAVVKSTSFPPYDPWYAGGYINYYYFGFVIIGTLIRLTGIVPAVSYNLAIPLLFALALTGAFSVGFNVAEALRQRIAFGEARRATVATSIAAGVATALLAVVLGNVDGAAQLLQGAWRTLNDGPFGFFDFWRSSRLMPGQIAINEFPYWTFLFGDLHAHLISLPFQVLAIGLALNLVLSAQGRPQLRSGLSSPPWRRVREGAVGGIGLWELAGLGFVVGSLAAINTWDVPAYGLLAVAAVGIVVLVRWWGTVRPALFGQWLLWSAVLWAFLYGLWLPFHQHYDAPGFGVHASQWRTVLWHYLAIHALLFFLAVTWLAAEAWRRFFAVPPNSPHPSPLPGSGPGQAPEGEGIASPDEENGLAPGNAALPTGLGVWFAKYGPNIWQAAAILGGLGLTVAALWNNVPSLRQWTTALVLSAFLALALVLAGWWIWQRRHPAAPVHLFLLAIVALALGIGIGVDFVTVDNDIDRMNTVFKFYLNAWLFYAVAGGVAVWRLLTAGVGAKHSVFRGDRSLRPRPNASPLLRAWTAFLVLLAVSSSVFLVLGTRARLADRFDNTLPLTLDGAAYQQVTVYHDPGPTNLGDLPGSRYALRHDADAIDYLRRNVEGSPVVLEGVSPQYRWTPRVAKYAGLPVVVGWEWHQLQQRGASGAEPAHVRQRIRDVEFLYTTQDTARVMELLRRYEVAYVYVGPTERLYFPASGVDKFESMVGNGLEVFHATEAVTIYRVHLGDDPNGVVHPFIAPQPDAMLAYNPAPQDEEENRMAEIVQIIRDILISVFLGAGILLTLALIIFSFILFKATLGVIRTARRTMDNFSKVSEATVEHVVEPLQEGVSFASTVGNAVGFATGFLTGMRGKRKRGRKDKDRDRDKGKRRGRDD